MKTPLNILSVSMMAVLAIAALSVRADERTTGLYDNVIERIIP
jgi:hypothetical protein